ncbi:MAG: endonuclease/exonuclease/phosphatase family protein [Sedimentisphaerales bacterium]|nr:endonuclease/exonuclease/phosphatase family protein [Sedimentisphaerales bacterium]
MTTRSHAPSIRRIFRWWIPAAVGLLLLHYGAAPAAAQADAPEDTKALRIMTFNIRYGTADDGENRWDKRKHLVAQVIRDYQPDVVGLQEALRFQLDYLQGELDGYSELGEGRDDGRTRGEYAALLYRRDRLTPSRAGTFWFSETPDTIASRHWGNSHNRICTWARLIDRKTDRAFYVYNLHLDHQSQQARWKGALLLIRRIQERACPDPFLVTGDFNAAEDNPAIQYLKGEIPPETPVDDDPSSPPVGVNPLPLVDTFRVLHPQQTSVRTSNPEFRGLTEGGKIDYIWTLPPVKVLQADIQHQDYDGRYPSDHYPVTAQIILPDS